jgi:hypothetical protein
MLGSHCRAIRYERHDLPFVADRGTSLKCPVWIRYDASPYVLVRFGALGCDMVTIGQFQVTRSVTIWCPVQIRSYTIWNELARADTSGYLPIRSSRTDAFCCDRIRFWPRWVSRVMTIRATIGPRRIYIQPDWLCTSLFHWRSWQIVANHSTSQHSVVFVLSKNDPDRHDLEARLDAMCRALLRSNTVWCDDHDWQLIVLIVEDFLTVKNFPTINTIATTDLKIWYDLIGSPRLLHD